MITLYGLVVCLIFRERCYGYLYIAFSLLPLILYVIWGIRIRNFLNQAVDANAGKSEYDRLQAASLTLTGFCFTSLSLLLSFFKEKIRDGDDQPEQIIIFFSAALIVFVSSYTILRFRFKKVIDYVSDGLLDNGLWFIFMGMLSFFRLNHNTKITYLFTGMLVFLGLCITRNIYLYATRSSISSPKQG